MDPQHLKVKKKDIRLTKNYCITISILKISSIRKFILKVQHGLHELKSHGHFLTTPTQKQVQCSNGPPVLRLTSQTSQN